MTLFVVVKSRAKVKKVLESAEAIVGNLDLPDTGILVAWPIEIIKGLPTSDEQEA
jgi:hypothetical protein